MFLMSLLDEAFQLQKTFPNVRSVEVRNSQKITVVGDLHGKLEDLLVIFEQNGIPSDTNPYVFNGDFVDRGQMGIEITVVLLGFQLLYPHSIFINRGNHEDYLMNKRYGFEAEVMEKYGSKGDGTPGRAQDIMRACAAVFSVLPLGVKINSGDKPGVMVLHGGISDKMTLETLTNVKRQLYVSILRAAKSEKLASNHDPVETKTIIDCVWSDPSNEAGCSSNAARGGGGDLWA